MDIYRLFLCPQERSRVRGVFFCQNRTRVKMILEFQKKYAYLHRGYSNRGASESTMQRISIDHRRKVVIVEGHSYVSVLCQILKKIIILSDQMKLFNWDTLKGQVHEIIIG
jgi:hypothetical protein